MPEDPDIKKPTDAGDSKATDTKPGDGQNAVREAYEGQQPTKDVKPVIEPLSVNAGDNDTLGAQTNRSIVTTNSETRETMRVRYNAAGMESTSYPPGTKLDENGNPPENVKPTQIIKQSNDGSRTVDTFTYNRDGSPSEQHSASYDRDRRLQTTKDVEYDPKGNVVSTTDTSYTNNAKGQITASEAVTKNANGQVTEKANTTYKYDDQGRPVSETTQVFDAQGKPVGTQTTDRTYGKDGSQTVTTKELGPDGKPLSETTTNYGVDGRADSQVETIYHPDGSKEVTTTSQIDNGDFDPGMRQVRERINSEGKPVERITTDTYSDHAIETDEMITDGKVQGTLVTKINADGSIESRGQTYPPGTAQRLSASGSIGDGIQNLKDLGDGSFDAAIQGLKDLGNNSVDNGIKALNELATASNTTIDTAIDAIGVYGHQQNATGSWGDHRQGIWLLKQAGKDPTQVAQLNERIEDGSVVNMSDRQLNSITDGNAFRAVDILAKIGDGDAALGMYRMQHTIGNGDTMLAREIMETDGNGTVTGAVPEYMRYSADGTFDSAVKVIKTADSQPNQTFQGGRADIITGMTDQGTVPPQGDKDHPASATVQDKDGNTITENYTYNPDGTRQKVEATTTDKDGKVTGKTSTEYEYGPDGKPTSQKVTSMDADGKVTGTETTTVQKGENGQTTVNVTRTDAEGKFLESNSTTTDANGNVVKTVVATAGRSGGESRNVTTTEYLEDGGTRTTYQRFNHEGREARTRVTEVHGDHATETENGHTTTYNADGSITRDGEEIYPPGTLQRLNSSGDVAAAIQSLQKFGDGSLQRGIQNIRNLGDARNGDFDKGIEVLNALAANGNTNIETAMAAVTEYGRQNDNKQDDIWGDTANGVYLLQQAGKDPAEVARLRERIDSGLLVTEAMVASAHDGDAIKGLNVFSMIGDGDAQKGMQMVRERIGNGDANAATKLMEEDGGGTVVQGAETYNRYSTDGTFKSAIDVISSTPGADGTFQGGREAILTFQDNTDKPGDSAFKTATDNLERVKPGDLAGAIQSVTNAGDEHTFISGATNVRGNSDDKTINGGITNWLRMGGGDFDKGTQEYARIAASDGVPGKISAGIESVRLFSNDGKISTGQDNIIRNSDDGTITNGVTNTIGMGDGKFDKGVQNYSDIAASNGRPGDFASAIDSVRAFSADGKIATAQVNLKYGSDDGTVTQGVQLTIGVGDGSFDKGRENYLKVAASTGHPGDFTSAIDSVRSFSSDGKIATATENLRYGSDDKTVTNGITLTIGVGDGNFDKGRENYLKVAESTGHPGDFTSAIDSVRSFSSDGKIATATENLRYGSDDKTVTNGITLTIGVGDGNFNTGRDNYLKVAESTGHPGDFTSAIDSVRSFSSDGKIATATENLKYGSDNGTVTQGVQLTIGMGDGNFNTGRDNYLNIAASNGHPGDFTAAIDSVRSFSSDGKIATATENLKYGSDNGTVTGGVQNTIGMGDGSFDKGRDNYLTIAASNGQPGDLRNAIDSVRQFSNDGKTVAGGIENLHAASDNGTVTSGVQNVIGASDNGKFDNGRMNIIAASPDGTVSGGIAAVSSLSPNNSFSEGTQVVKAAGDGIFSNGTTNIAALGEGNFQTGGEVLKSLGGGDAARGAETLKALGNGDTTAGVAAYNQIVQQQGGNHEAAIASLANLGHGDVLEGARVQAGQPQNYGTNNNGGGQAQPERHIEDKPDTPDPIRYVAPGTTTTNNDPPVPVYTPRFTSGNGLNRMSYFDEQATKIDSLIGKMKALTDSATATPVAVLFPPVAGRNAAGSTVDASGRPIDPVTGKPLDANGKPISFDANGRPIDANGKPIDPAALRGIPGVEALFAKLKESSNGTSIDRSTLEALRLGNPLSFYGDKVFHQIAMLPMGRSVEASVHVSGAQRGGQPGEITVSRVGLSAIAAQQGFSGPFRVVGPGGTVVGSESGLRGAFTMRGPGGELVTILSYGGKITVIRGGVGDGRGTGFTIDGGKVSDAMAIRRGMVKGGSLSDMDGPVLLTARKWRNFKKRQLIGVEIALALLLTSTAIARQLDANKDQAAAPDAEEKNKQLAKASYQVITRPTWLVRPGEDLVKLAEHLFHEAEIGWLIADLNVGQTRETYVDGKRIVELQTRQRIELPVWQDIIEFHKSMVRMQVNPENLITVVSEAAFDAELVQTTLAAAMGVSAMPTPAKAPTVPAFAKKAAAKAEPVTAAAKQGSVPGRTQEGVMPIPGSLPSDPTAPAFATAGFIGKVRLTDVRRAVAFAKQYKDVLLNQQEETDGPTGTAGATLDVALRQLRTKPAT